MYLREHLGGLDKICIFLSQSVVIQIQIHTHLLPVVISYFLGRQSDFSSINESVIITAESVACNFALFGAGSVAACSVQQDSADSDVCVLHTQTIGKFLLQRSIFRHTTSPGNV